jgi:hypothetical protein
MATLIFKGFYDALAGGLLETTPDVRVLLVMPGTTCDTEEDAAVLADFTAVDEFDGVGYARLNLAGVTTGYDATDDEWQLLATSGDFGNPVAPGSDVIQGMVVYLHVDGTAANDVPLGYSSDGGFGVNANNGALDLTIPANGLMFNRSA